MKNIFTILIIIFLFSCTKDRPASIQGPPNSNVFLKYKANGALQEYSGDAGDTPEAPGVIASKLLKGTAIPQTLYTLHAIRGANNVFAFGIYTDTLTTGNYTGAELLTLTSINGNEYGCFDSTNQKFNISISRNSLGSIDGNFSGKLYWYDQQTTTFSSVSISEGEFKNVRIIY